MKSGKQRRLEIKTKRRERAEALKVDAYRRFGIRPRNRISADHSQLAHNNVYDFLPMFYVDKPFKCRACENIEVWTAKQQKWWYEIVKEAIESTAVHCKACRAEIRERKKRQKTHMLEMAKRKPHPNEAFFKKRYH